MKQFVRFSDGNGTMPHLHGLIFECYGEKNNSEFKIIILDEINTDGQMHWNKGDKTFVSKNHVIDITPIYNKIIKLYRICKKKDVYGDMERILNNFKKGIYPTKEEFKSMNTIWNEVK